MRTNAFYFDHLVLKGASRSSVLYQMTFGSMVKPEVENINKTGLDGLDD
jgi:hypothetical protein